MGRLGMGDRKMPLKGITCRKCDKANPIGSLFCSECDASLRPHLLLPLCLVVGVLFIIPFVVRVAKLVVQFIVSATGITASLSEDFIYLPLVGLLGVLALWPIVSLYEGRKWGLRVTNVLVVLFLVFFSVPWVMDGIGTIEIADGYSVGRVAGPIVLPILFMLYINSQRVRAIMNGGKKHVRAIPNGSSSQKAPARIDLYSRLIMSFRTLPKKMSCPKCRELLSLSKTERKERSFSCPHCDESFVIGL